MQEAGQLVIDALNVGLAAMHKVPEEELKESVLGFVQKYGFLGFMTALYNHAGTGNRAYF